MKRDLNYIAALEKSMSQKYGAEAIQNPAQGWTPDKELKYIEEVKEARKKEYAAEQSNEKVDLNGVLLPKKLINKNSDRTCKFCKAYSFNRNDDLFLTKFKSCFKCYIEKIEGR